jgi:hypothetical protein
MLQFINSTDGRLVTEEICDPQIVLPFDEAELRSFARGRVFIYPDDTQNPYVQWDQDSAINELMRHWSDAYYDMATSSLILSTYRATFTVAPIPPLPGRNPIQKESILSPFYTPDDSTSDGIDACVMKKVWVRVELED